MCETTRERVRMCLLHCQPMQGGLVKYFRKGIGLSRAQLARLLKVTPRAVYSWEVEKSCDRLDLRTDAALRLLFAEKYEIRMVGKLSNFAGGQ